MNRAEAKRIACSLVLSAATGALEGEDGDERIEPYVATVADREKLDEALEELFRELGRRATYRRRR